MTLSSLRLRNFRCFDALSRPLPAGTTLFIGENAQGKTSILEAVCMLLRLQSPRTQKPAEMLKTGAAEYGIGGTLGGRELLQRFSEGRRFLSVDGEEVKKPANFLAASGLVVWMGNGDMELIAGSGEARRRYLDFLGSQFFSDYRATLLGYDKALRSRNALFKRDASPNWPEIDAYTEILARYGAILQERRGELCALLLPCAQEAHHAVSGQRESFSLRYVPSGAGNLLSALAESREEEARRRVTVVGPHRDDVSLFIDERPAAAFASEGQQRTMALALKLAQVSLLRAASQAAPILLLDDIFGELDPRRRNALLEFLPQSSQKLITTTHIDWMEKSHPADAIYRVSGGALME